MPAPTNDLVIPLTVSSRLTGVRSFQIDVDLNHDGRFEGRGEFGYAEGRIDRIGTAHVRLHGLVEGRYRVRARVQVGGRDIVSAVQSLEVLPPPGNRLPVTFEPNRGQADSAVLFLGRAQNQTVYVTTDETIVATRGSSQRFRLVGANGSARPIAQKKLPGASNYFIGNDPSKWRSNIATYKELLTRDVYPGIDLVYHSIRGRLEYDFRVAAGADPAVIGLEFPDAAELSIDTDGGLVVRQADGQELRKSAPIMYQDQSGRLEGVKGSWVLKGGKHAGYFVADYDPRRELVIDPLIFSSYYGGTLNEDGWAIAVDGAGNSYITGSSDSVNFPTTAGAVQTTLGALADAVIVKLNPAGTAVIYSTFLGGVLTDIGNAIAVDAAGNVYVAGTAGSANFPTTAGAFQTVKGVGNDAFVAKLNPAGSALLYSTFLGGAGGDSAKGIAINAAGNAYVTGDTDSNNFPTTAGAFDTTFSGGSTDAFVAELNPAGTALVYSTYLGGSTGGADDIGRAITVDGAGNAYVTGESSSLDFPTTAGAFQTANGGALDAFVTKLNPAGSALGYSTFVGGTLNDRGLGIAIDPAGNAYIVGYTNSNNFPTTAGAFQTVQQNPANDAFVTKLNPAGTARVYSTYLGGGAPGGGNVGRAIAIDAAGNAYVSGGTDSDLFPTVNPIQAARAGGFDAFVAIVNPAGSALVGSTYLGGAALDGANALAVDASGAIYVAGITFSANFPTLVPVQAANGGQQDLFITKLTFGVGPPPVGVTITQSGGTTTVTEGGATDTYTLVLNVAPTANVTITINPGTQVTVAPAIVTFTPANWNVAQTVTVMAVDDALVEGPHAGTITHTSASTDAAYNAIVIGSVTANITDNDTPPPIAGVLYGVAFSNELITINTTTGAGTLVGPLSTNMQASGLGFRGNDLYAWDTIANRVRHLNPATGATVATIDIGIISSTAGDLAFRSDGLGFTCAATPVSTFWSCDITVPNATVIVSPLVPNMYGLAFNPANVLYGLRQTGAELYTINQSTGATTLVGPTGLPALIIGALACDSAGNLYAALGSGAGSSSLYRIDASTGTATVIGSIGFASVSGITFAPQPIQPPPPPGGPGGGPGEGNYPGSAGPPNGGHGEGSYGFGGGGFGFGGIPTARTPILHGPLATGTSFRVLNVSHRIGPPSDSETGFGPLGWTLVSGLALALMAVAAVKYRSM